jgi:hypothetical protein
MKFHSSAKIVTELKQAIREETDADKVLFNSTDILSAPLSYTKIYEEPSDGGKSLTDRTTMPEINLHDLFTKFDEIDPKYKGRNAYRTKFNVISIQPENWKDICQMRCPDCHYTFGCSNIPKTNKSIICPECKHKGCSPIYMIQMVCKDDASALNKNFYRVMLYSYAPEMGYFFFGKDLLPCNLYLEEN